MRRRLLTLPVLLALVLGVLAAPSGAAGAADGDPTTGSISGTLTLPDGDVTAATVRVYSEGADGLRSHATVHPDAEGRWSATVPPGTYRVRFDGPSQFDVTSWWGGGAHLGEARSIDVPAGEDVTGIDTEVVTGGHVYFRAEQSLGGRALQVRYFAQQPDGTWRRTGYGSVINSLGNVRTGIPAGTYRAQITPFGYEARDTCCAPLGERLTGDASFYPAAATIEEAEDIVVERREVARRVVPAPPPQPVTPLAEPTVTQSDSGPGTFSVSDGSWPEGSAVVSRQWFHVDFYSPLQLHAIPGATGRSVTPPRELVGLPLIARTTVRSPGRPDTHHWSAPSTITAPFATTPTLSLRDVVADGSARPVLTGDWGTSGVRLTYEWSVDGEKLHAGSTTTYVPRRAVGRRLSLRLVATKDRQRSVLVASSVVKPATRRVAERPALEDVQVGKRPTALAQRESMWTPEPDWAAKDHRLTQTWLLDGRTIRRPGKLLPSWVGRRLQVRYVLAQTGYPTVTATSRAVRIRPATFRGAAAPTLSDYTLVPGQWVTMTVPRSWSPRPLRLQYRWFVDGRQVKGATRPHLTVARWMVGKRLQARVIGTRKGYTSVVRRSSRAIVRVRF